MAELFTRAEVNFGGAMHSQLGLITSDAGVDIGVLLQNLQLQYSQQVTRIYELGVSGKKTSTYYVAGRSQGQVQAAHIIGPGVALTAFYNKFSDVCQAGTNTLTIGLGPNVCGTPTGSLLGSTLASFGAAGGNVSYTMKYCVLVGIGMSVSVQDYVVNENSTIMFTGLDFSG